MFTSHASFFVFIYHTFAYIFLFYFPFPRYFLFLPSVTTFSHFFSLFFVFLLDDISGYYSPPWGKFSNIYIHPAYRLIILLCCLCNISQFASLFSQLPNILSVNHGLGVLHGALPLISRVLIKAELEWHERLRFCWWLRCCSRAGGGSIRIWWMWPRTPPPAGTVAVGFLCCHSSSHLSSAPSYFPPASKPPYFFIVPLPILILSPFRT
jgi:hypothetical protein